MLFDFARFKPVISEDILRAFWKQLLQVLGGFVASDFYVYAHRLVVP